MSSGWSGRASVPGGDPASSSDASRGGLYGRPVDPYTGDPADPCGGGRGENPGGPIRPEWVDSGSPAGQVASGASGPGGSGAHGQAGYGGAGGNGGAPPGRVRRRRPRWGRIALVLGVVVALVAGGLVLSGYLYVQHANAKFQHIDAFSTIPGPRPAKVNDGSENILLLGSDSRNAARTADLSGWRTDTIILMHVTADHKHAYLISIPRDSWVHIPKSMSQPNRGNTNAKINAAFSWGGVPLTVETIEQFTNVYIDHVVLINFAGFKEVTDALGGVDMYVEKTIKSIHSPYRTYTKGTHHFTGSEALDYVRQRYQYADGDLTRVKHQQEFLKAIMDKATSTGTLTNLGKMNSFLDALSKAVLVDKGFDLGSMAWQLHSLRSSDMTFLTSPTSGFATEADGESAVVVDKAKAAALYAAVRNDTVASWVKDNKAA
ncbi:MAG TPA: LCP family protein [Micromonosporaceae bacterium]|jgi:LCP family protein required for cell wall assembly|nr:LCP family protein [Micromonosporaceae bacterium]